MARWAPLKQDTLDALAAEISHNYGTGFALVGISGADAPAFAAELADSFGDRPVRVAAIDAAPLPVRTDEPDTLVLVTGAVTSDPALAGHWNYTVFLEDRNRLDRTTRAAASAIVDVTDPEHPRRSFADSC